MILDRMRHLQFRLFSRKKKFTDIYTKGGFSSGVNHPVSGTGSTLEQTGEIMKVLPDLIRDFKIIKILDAPCGDYNWMKEVELGKEIEYIGADIVGPLINENNRRYSRPKVDFIEADIVSDPLPKVDMIMCRDCLIHLSNEDARKALRNFSRSGARYLLTTTFRSLGKNREMVSGRGWRPVNLEIAPFKLKKPIQYIEEKSTEKDAANLEKCLGLWAMDEIADML